MFNVEKNIPVPPKREKYPFHKMEVGDSFLVQCANEEKRRVQTTILAVAGHISGK